MNGQFSRTMMAHLVLADSVVVFTGAGVSAESGVPTFRGAGGIWKKFRPEELASMDAFLKNPALVWEWYSHRKKIIAEVRPNPGHHALVHMEKLFRRFDVITQNIDNLHRRAGSTRVHELHGNIERNYCMNCGTAYPDNSLGTMSDVPQCGKCGGLIRPDVVWFGEMLPEEEWTASARAAASCDVFFSVGTSAVVYPAASLPFMAKQAGAFLVEINAEPTSLTDHADEFLQGPSGVILPALVAAVACVRTDESSTISPHNR